ncbi:MAG: putative membrane protein (Fun14 family) [Porticoccaceae bacterium]|jgi:uncharacterized membrane protein (Fun14 family)
MKPVFEKFGLWYFFIATVCLAYIQLSTLKESCDISDLSTKVGSYITSIQTSRISGNINIEYQLPTALSKKANYALKTFVPVVVFDANLELSFKVFFILGLQKKWRPEAEFRGSVRLQKY